MQMRRQFTATVWQEGNWFVAQCLQVDVASQGESEAAALENLKEAVELYFEEPKATIAPKTHEIVVNLDAA
jgi:predicted RNase H-like HicB family nuclease